MNAFNRAIVDRLFLSKAPASCRFTITLVFALVLTASCGRLLAQENFLVVTQDGVVSLVDLATYSLIESFQNEPLTYTISASPNQRLAFMAGGSGYGSVADTSIARAVASLTGVRATSSTVGHGGKYYLAPDYNNRLDVVDTATLQTVKTVDLGPVIPSSGLPGAIVAANDQTYILPRVQSHKVAVVNLTNFQLSSVSLSAGSFCRRCAARTPDGSVVVVVENNAPDGKTHVVLINTTTNQIISDIPQTKNYSVTHLVVTPNSSGPLYGYVYSNSSQSLMTLDLRPNSQTYGQILPNTAVTIPNLSLDDIAINSDGSRVIVVGAPTVQPPAPNVAVVDTVNQVLAAQITVNGGVLAFTACIGSFSTTSPNGAPTVTGVSGDIINNQDNDVTISGTNFQTGAVVRIGSLPLSANVLDPTTLTVTVPAGAPAGRAQDIIVTNPMINMPPNQQNESGLLAAKFNILPNPSFHPTTQFATGNSALLYVYDLKQQSLAKIPTGHSEGFNSGFAFNADGKSLYLASAPTVGDFYVLPIDLSTNTPGAPISLPSDAYTFSQQPVNAGRDPQKGTPVIYALWVDFNDMHLSKIDSDSSSPTYNTIVATFNAGFSENSFPTGEAISVTPDGKYAYVWYYTDNAYLGIFNLSTGAFTSIRYDSLRVSSYQSQIGITADGKSMLLATYYGNRTRVKVFDISNPISPKALAEITPLPIPSRGFPFVDNYQVIGNKLYAIDLTGAVIVFNFDRTKGDFRERGWVTFKSNEFYFSGFSFSADGSYLYFTDYYRDLVLVADSAKLEKGGNPMVTSIRSPYTPYLLSVSPVAPPLAQATLQRQSQSRSRRSPGVAGSVLPN